MQTNTKKITEILIDPDENGIFYAIPTQIAPKHREKIDFFHFINAYLQDGKRAILQNSDLYDLIPSKMFSERQILSKRCSCSSLFFHKYLDIGSMMDFQAS